MDSDAGTPVPLDDWLDRVRAALDEAEAATLSQDERVALLDLTRLAAHRSERVAGPLTVYLLGLALADAAPAARLERITALTKALAGG